MGKYSLWERTSSARAIFTVSTMYVQEIAQDRVMGTLRSRISLGSFFSSYRRKYVGIDERASVRDKRPRAFIAIQLVGLSFLISESRHSAKGVGYCASGMTGSRVVKARIRARERLQRSRLLSCAKFCWLIICPSRRVRAICAGYCAIPWVMRRVLRSELCGEQLVRQRPGARCGFSH